MLNSPRHFDSLLPGHGIFGSRTIKKRFLLKWNQEPLSLPAVILGCNILNSFFDKSFTIQDINDDKITIAYLQETLDILISIEQKPV